ncbi:MAG: FGGY-family carbohydrate kinase [Lachnospiraceae bacterium]
MAWLGIDVGTTACKAILYDSLGLALESTRKEYRLKHPQNGWAEIDPLEMWEAVKVCVRQVAKGSEREIKALAISSHGEGVIPFDAQYKEIGPEIVSFDNRSVQEAKELEEAFGRAYFFERGGQLLSSVGTLSKIMWMNKHSYYLGGKAYAFMCAGDYIAFKLTGRRVIDYSLASRTMLFDVHTKEWNHELLEYVGLEPTQMSKPVQSGTFIGDICKECSNDLGLPANIAVVAGGHDQPCAMLGSGVLEPSTAIYSTGTTETLVCSINKFKPEMYKYGLCCYPHVLKEQYITLAGNFTGGNLLQWFKSILVTSGEEVYSYKEMMDEMVDYPSKIMVLPHFTTTGSPWNDSESFGMVSGLSLTTTRGELIRAFQEGVTMEILLNFELLNQLGVDIKKMIVVGGSTRSEKLMKMKADILGVPLSIPKDGEAACRGAAYLASEFCGAGMIFFSDDDKQENKMFPDVDTHRHYIHNLIKYKRMYQGQKEIWR